MEKHSITINGHRTSFSLERDFWDELKAIAADRRQSLSQLVATIDAERSVDTNLSSALRLHVLHDVKSRFLPES